ncbi:hypothetical protein LguiA_022556 [Lonicera macranthoides]
MSSFFEKRLFQRRLGRSSRNGREVLPIATYNMTIQGLGKMGRADLANTTIDNLMKLGGYFDMVMYNTLINALGRASWIDEANRVFQQMGTSGINDSKFDYLLYLPTPLTGSPHFID